MSSATSLLAEDLLAEISEVYGKSATAKVDDTQMDFDPSAPKVMIVDDEILNIKLARKYLQDAGYSRFVQLTDPQEAFDCIRVESPDIILLDVMMPKVSGLEILKWIRSEPEVASIPVIILTASTDRDTKLKALELGATDFLTKPLDCADLLPRVRNAYTIKQHYDHLKNYTQKLEREVQLRTAELAKSRLEVVHCLARAAEFRDDVTGQHVYRVGRYAALIARELGLSDEQCHMIELAAQLHDIGKIAVPDSILKKSDKLDSDEVELIRKHCVWGKQVFDNIEERHWIMFRDHPKLGKQLLETSSSPLLRIASRIALTHHERWDGNGYPLGLSGTDIPLEGRITSIADVFDALRSKRPYKTAFSIQECLEFMEEGRGTQFDPEVLDAFFRCKDEIVAIQIEFADN